MDKIKAYTYKCNGCNIDDTYQPCIIVVLQFMKVKPTDCLFGFNNEVEWKL